MKIIIFLSVVALASATQGECGKNQVYTACGTACPLTCDNYQNPPKICTLQCIVGCECAQGFVKANKTCVKPEECPAKPPKCTENQVYTACGTACPLTCDNYQNPPKICIDLCVVGCVCEKGFVKANNTCVKPEECPAKPQKCPENQVYTACGTACPLTCDNLQNPPERCTLQCVIGCVCEKGFVKANKTCVKPEECPAKPPEKKTCLGEPETGMCKAYIPSWYYDVNSGQCKAFIYGGCGGNGNRYSTEEECKKNCGGKAA